MSLSPEDVAFVRDLFSGVPNLRTRRMFGGLGLYSGDTIFALMRSDGSVLVKAERATPFAARLEGMGCQQWTYSRKSRAISAMPYWTLPEAALDDPEMAGALASDALAELTRDAV